MSVESILSRYAGGTPAGLTPAAAAVDGEAEEVAAFGWLRGLNSQAMMLELRKKDGTVKAFGYAWLSEAEFDPSAGITLTFGGRKVRLVGRHLDAEVRPNVRLFSGLLRHRVNIVRETDEGGLMVAGEGETVVEQIEW